MHLLLLYSTPTTRHEKHPHQSSIPTSIPPPSSSPPFPASDAPGTNGETPSIGCAVAVLSLGRAPAAAFARFAFGGKESSVHRSTAHKPRLGTGIEGGQGGWSRVAQRNRHIVDRASSAGCRICFRERCCLCVKARNLCKAQNRSPCVFRNMLSSRTHQTWRRNLRSFPQDRNQLNKMNEVRRFAVTLGTVSNIYLKTQKYTYS